MNEAKPINEAKRVTLIGAGVNLLLAVCKICIGKISHSHALIADGVHSLSDLLTDALVMVTSHYGSQDADKEHPYGHRRIETVGSIVLAVVLILVAIGIMYDAITHIMTEPNLVKPGMIALVMAVISVIANEWLYQITKIVGVRIHSAVLIANAWHHRSDAASSLIVVIGLLGTFVGWLFLDAAAAVLVALMILRMGGKLVWTGLRELIDTSVEPRLYDKIKQVITDTPGVAECHELRTRFAGGKIFTDVHVIVAPKVSVSEGHRIGEQVELNLFQSIEHMHDVIVHIDPEDDEHCAPCKHLPLRHVVIQQIHDALAEVVYAQHIDQFTLHYLSGKLHIQLGVPLSVFPDKATMMEFETQVLPVLKALPQVEQIQLFFYSTT